MHTESRKRAADRWPVVSVWRKHRAGCPRFHRGRVMWIDKLGPRPAAIASDDLRTSARYRGRVHTMRW
jgi:hypothetical protein